MYLSWGYSMTRPDTTQKCINTPHYGPVGRQPAPNIFPYTKETFSKGKMFWNKAKCWKFVISIKLPAVCENGVSYILAVPFRAIFQDHYQWKNLSRPRGVSDFKFRPKDSNRNYGGSDVVLDWQLKKWIFMILSVPMSPLEPFGWFQG